MKTVLLSLVISVFIVSTSFAEDLMAPIFEQIEDLLNRVDSGVSLNSFAETHAGIKTNYRKIQKDPICENNPLLRDRIKEVVSSLDDYVKVWKIYETEGYKLTGNDHNIFSKYPVAGCETDAQAYDKTYTIACVKQVIFDGLKPKIEKAKSAHFNGW